MDSSIRETLSRELEETGNDQSLEHIPDFDRFLKDLADFGEEVKEE